VAFASAIASFLLVSVIAATPRSPLQPVLPAGAAPSGPFRRLSGLLGVDRFSADALVAASVVAVALAAAVFLLLLRMAWRRELSVRVVLVMAIAFHAGVLLLPLLISRDVYSYGMYGRIAGLYRENPYVVTPLDVRGDPLFSLIGPKWAGTPAVYGPGFTALSAGLTRWLDGIPALITAYRVIAAGAGVASTCIVVWVVRRLRPERAAFAAALIGLNPVVLFQSVGSGHNDVLVMLAVAGAFALVVLEVPLLATVALTLGMLVKATAALPLFLLVLAVTARSEPGRRLRTLLAHVAVSAGIFAFFALPFLQTRDPSLGMLELSRHEGWLAPSRFVRRIVEGIGDVIGAQAVGSSLAIAVRVAFALALVLVVVLIARSVWRRAGGGGFDVTAMGASWGWALLALMLLGPVLLPWYVTWVLPLAWLLPRVPRSVTIGVSTALAVSQWAAEPGRYPGAYELNILVGHYVITPVVVGLLAWLIVDLRRRLREDTPLEEERREVAAGAG
jgi:hypothetical protein